MFRNLAATLRKVLGTRHPYCCPVCDNTVGEFLPLPDFYRDQAARFGFKYFGTGEMTSLATYTCPRCGATDRERLYADWINQQIERGQFKKGIRLLHFAPEPALSKAIQKVGFFEYQTADMGMSDVDHSIDITDMPLPDEYCDFFICSHVLEHVESDDRAIQELYRVTRSGGIGILMAPVSTALQHTIEDPTETSESERWRLFGQHDHVRLYAHGDFVEKIRSNGFLVQQLGIETFGGERFGQLGLKPTSILYIVEKP